MRAYNRLANPMHLIDFKGHPKYVLCRHGYNKISAIVSRLGRQNVEDEMHNIMCVYTYVYINIL